MTDPSALSDSASVAGAPKSPDDSLTRRFDPSRGFCITDVGSTTTKAILFRRDKDWRFWYEEVPTTVEKPCEDVTIGVTRSLQALERASGQVCASALCGVFFRKRTRRMSTVV